MEKRRLGRTGHESTVVTFGAFSLGEISQGEADRTIALAMEHGLNHIDIAPRYGEALERLAPSLPRIRDRVFLGAKTTERTASSAREGIRGCLRRLSTDSVDLFQLHGVTTMEQLDLITGPDGALEALVEMREQGHTRWIGITGHGADAPRIQIEALNRFDFDTIMFPCTASMYPNIEYRRNAEELLALAVSRDVGIQAIKMLARGGWGDRPHDSNVWYDPHREQEDIDRAIWWQLSQPIHTAPSTGDPRLFSKVLDAAERFVRLTSVELEEIVRSQAPPLPEPRLAILPAR